MPNAPLPKPATPTTLTPPGLPLTPQPAKSSVSISNPTTKLPLDASAPVKPIPPTAPTQPQKPAPVPPLTAAFNPAAMKPPQTPISPSIPTARSLSPQASTQIPSRAPTQVPVQTPVLNRPPQQPVPAKEISASPAIPPLAPPTQMVKPTPPTVTTQPQKPASIPIPNPANPPLAKPPQNLPVPAASRIAPQNPTASATPVVKPIPGPASQPPAQAVAPAPVRVQQPPQTLTALSSMASNKLPSGAMKAPIDVSTDSAAASAAKNPVAQPTAPNQPNLGPKKPEPEFVQPQKSVLRFLPFVGGGILLLLIVAFVFLRFFGGSRNSVSTTPTQNSGNSAGTGQTGNPTGSGAAQPVTGKQVTLEYWGLWEPTETMTEVIKNFESQNPGITIKYVKQSHKDYRTRVQSAINSGNGPDLFRFHASWVPMLKQELSALPSAVMSASEYQSTFYPIAVQQLQNNGQLVGIPLMYDGLVLFYNTDIFKTAVADPPKTWPDLRTLANKLSVKSEGKLTRSGIALGNAVNVEHFADVLSVLILQNGGDLTKPNSAEVRDALLFYTNFVKTDGVWNDTLPSSTVAFARGEAAMMFAPSWRAHDVKAINPDLKFATVPLPQLSDKRIAWGSYWAEGVSAKSTHKDESWKFIKYMSSKEVQQKLFAEQAKTRSFGELFSRRDLADLLVKDPVAASVLQDAGYAQGWYMSSYTHDNGINDQIIQYYKDAVNGLLTGKSMEDVLVTLDSGVSQVLRQYGVVQGTGQAPVK